MMTEPHNKGRTLREDMIYDQMLTITDIHQTLANLSLSQPLSLPIQFSGCVHGPQGLSTDLHLIEETWADLKNEQFLI